MSKLSPLDRAECVYRRAKRLVRLLQLNAPAIVIEQERALVVSAALDLPIDEEQREARRAFDASIKEDEMAWLQKTGYFKEIEDDLEGGAQ